MVSGDVIESFADGFFTSSDGPFVSMRTVIVCFAVLPAMSVIVSVYTYRPSAETSLYVHEPAAVIVVDDGVPPSFVTESDADLKFFSAIVPLRVNALFERYVFSAASAGPASVPAVLYI